MPDFRGMKHVLPAVLPGQPEVVQVVAQRANQGLHNDFQHVILGVPPQGKFRQQRLNEGIEPAWTWPRILWQSGYPEV